MSAFWRGLPSPPKIYDWLRRSLFEGLDSTQRSFKLAIAESLCGTRISDKLFFTGYGGGSSLGFAQTLGMYLLTQCKKDASGIPQVSNWLRSLTCINATFVVYRNPLDRLFDSIGSKSRSDEVEETHPLMFALWLKQAVADMPPGFEMTKTVFNERVKAHNDRVQGASRIGSGKQKAAETLALWTPDDVLAVWVVEYRQCTWEKMYLNAVESSSAG